MSALKIVKYTALASALGLVVGASNWGLTLWAQSGAAEALQKAKVLERLAERTPTAKGGTAPSFVLDPAWPKVLPNNWVIGDVGGIAVDSHDNIWVYHRPRAINTTDSGA